MSSAPPWYTHGYNLRLALENRGSAQSHCGRGRRRQRGPAGEQKTYPHLLAGNASWRLAREAFRSSWSRYAWHRSQIQQLLRARTKFQITATARAGRLGRAEWSGDGPGRRRPQVRVAWDSRSSPFFIPGSSREGVSPSGTPTPSAHTRRPRRPRRVRGYR